MNDATELLVTTQQTPPWKAIHTYVSQRVHALQIQYLQEVPAAKAQLAQLRRINPVTSQGVFAFWALTQSHVPERLVGRGDNATDVEQAIATALHLYAIHQQSRAEPMHRAKISFGDAMRQLQAMEHFSENVHPIMKRYNALLTATDLPEMAHHLRGIIGILRDKRIPLDYGALAEDLYLLSLPNARTSVRLRWSRDLIRKAVTSSEHTTETVTSDQE